MDEIIRKQVQLVHPQKVYGYLQGFTEDKLAGLFGIPSDEYNAIKNEFSKQVLKSCEELCSDPNFLHRLRSIPFRENEIIMALGESTTDDLLSWFMLLQKCIGHALPEKNIRFHNAAISGQTTSMALRKLTADLQAKPTLIICMLGMNDTLQIGGRFHKTLVDFKESVANLEIIRNIARDSCQPDWLWITPYTIDEQKQDNNYWFKQMQFRWLNKNIQPLIEHMAGQQTDSVLNLQKEFEPYKQDVYLTEDGIHLSLGGHKRVVEGVVKTLSLSA